MGYCPQFDALFETLTGREHLRLYAAIKVRFWLAWCRRFPIASGRGNLRCSANIVCYGIGKRVLIG